MLPVRTKSITIWITEEEHQEAKRKAAAEERSLSWLVRRLLRDFIPTSKKHG